MSAETGDIISRVYGGFRGVDFRGEEVNLVRSPDSKNMWKDYRKTDSVRTRPKIVSHLDNLIIPVTGIWFYKEEMIYQTGIFLNKYVNGVATYIGNLSGTKSNGFIFKDIFYLMDGYRYYQYDGTTFKEVVGYIPTTTIGRKGAKPDEDGNYKPSGGGTIHEDYNMLSDYRINTFLADGHYEDKRDENGAIVKGDDGKPIKEWAGSVRFYLDVESIDSDYAPEIKVDDKIVEGYTVNYEEAYIEFTKAPEEPKTSGKDNISVKFKKAVTYKDANGNDVPIRNTILNCTMVQFFDNRIFVSGNPNFPNKLWHCSLDDPTYFSDLDYYTEGADNAKIKGMVAGNNALWVMREPSDANTNVFYHTPTIDSTYGKIYPSSHSSITTGCVGKAINFNDDIVFFSDRGMEGISGDITTEQVIAHRSTLVDAKMISDTNYTNMILEEWDGYLLVFIGKKVFLADSRTAFNNDNHIEYEWFYWELDELGDNTIYCTKVHDGILYIGTSNGIYKLTDNDSDVASHWVTPKDKFKAPHKLKTTNKRGCVVEAEGDVSVAVKTEADTDFELIGTYENVTDYFVSRIKRKKFKDIQLKFYSNKRFSLETATLECFLGGYIKR